MITFSRSYTVGDQTFATLELAQQHEIIALLKDEVGQEVPSVADEKARNIIFARVATVIVGHKAKVLDILTTKANSRTRARSVNGARKTRKSKDVPAKAPETAKCGQLDHLV